MGLDGVGDGFSECGIGRVCTMKPSASWGSDGKAQGELVRRVYEMMEKGKRTVQSGTHRFSAPIPISLPSFLLTCVVVALNLYTERVRRRRWTETATCICEQH